MSVYLALENISKYYTAGQSVVMGLNHVSLSFRIGEFVAVTGESGSGKSTLAKVMAGIVPYEGGEMYINGNPTSHYGHAEWEQYRISRVSFISQNYDILPGCSVLENVVSALLLMGIGRKEAMAEAEDILEQVELTAQKNRKAGKLSSGQKQRLSIARALAKPAPILIADEPTGNLDSENSEKVIRMLAAAAKERLVIVVTHDYDEVEEYASRHITVRDGEIDSDATLRQITVEIPGKQEEKPEKREGRTFKGLSRYIAGLQMRSRPIWSVMMLLLFMLTAAATFMFLGTFTVNLDDSFTRRYDDSAFLNGSKTRIVAAKSDLTEMSAQDLEGILALPYVEGIERYGFLSDINYHYRDNIDYQYHYIAETDEYGNPTGYVRVELTLEDTDLFLQTIPCMKEENNFLSAGRMPENMYEVVAVGDESLIGTQILIFIDNRNNWGQGSYIKFEATVVGVTDQGEHLYFDWQLGRVLTGEYVGSKCVIAPDYGRPPEQTRFRISLAMFNAIFRSISERQKVMGGMEYQRIAEEVYKEEYIFPDYENPGAELVMTPCGEHDSTLKNYLLVNPEDFERVTPDIYGNVISVNISDYAYVDEVLDGIQSLGHHAVSPYRIGTTTQDETLAAERLQTLKVCILAALAVFLLQVLALRAMFGMEMEEYRLLANLGLGRRMAAGSVFWQLLLFTVGGQFLAAAAIFIGSLMDVEQIGYVLKYLPGSDIALFMLVHLAAGLLAALWIRMAVDKQIYPSDLQYLDLKMGDEVSNSL